MHTAKRLLHQKRSQQTKLHMSRLDEEEQKYASLLLLEPLEVQRDRKPHLLNPFSILQNDMLHFQILDGLSQPKNAKIISLGFTTFGCY